MRFECIRTLGLELKQRQNEDKAARLPFGLLRCDIYFRPEKKLSCQLVILDFLMLKNVLSIKHALKKLE